MANLEQIRNRIREYTNNGGGIDSTEQASLASDSNIEIPAEDGSVRTGQVNWQKLLQEIGGAGASAQPGASSVERLEALLLQINGDYGEFLSTKEQLANLASGGTTAELNQHAELLAKQEVILARLNYTLQQAQPMAQQFNKLSDMQAEWFQTAGLPVPEGVEEGPQVSVTPRAMTAGIAGGEQGQKSGNLTGGARAQTAQFPTLKANVSSGVGDPTDAYLKTLSMDNAVANIYDEVQNNTKRGKELVLLFAYYAQRAASGDMGAMYQFQKFLTYIISKDKAKQQIDLGKKLIQLQDDSRRATNKLLNAKFDPNDPNASFEQSKLLTQVKSETDAIATSQKLIGQSMEEFGVVVETLTSLEKSSLEAWKRTLQKITA